VIGVSAGSNEVHKTLELPKVLIARISISPNTLWLV
jgi:hypothetical protein